MSVTEYRQEPAADAAVTAAAAAVAADATVICCCHTRSQLSDVLSLEKTGVAVQPPVHIVSFGGTWNERERWTKYSVEQMLQSQRKARRSPFVPATKAIAMSVFSRYRTIEK